MKVQNDRLTAESETEKIKQQETPNRGGVITPKYLVFHFTAGRSAESSVAWLCNPDAKASAHLVVGRDGGITQLAPFRIKTWHAGKSSWAGLNGLNQYSIGIEMDNAGKLTKVGDKYQAGFGAAYPESEVVRARHKDERDEGFWHAYTEAQIDRALELAKLLVKTYNLADILGHEDIAPGRKVDPGPAFPLTNIRAAACGQLEVDEELYQVTIDSLNIRKGPGVEFDTVSSPLMRGAKLTLLEQRDRWSKVDVEGPNDIEGWVASKYLAKV
jgi:N-acetylmuramoyl-L-alanine amidase